MIEVTGWIGVDDEQTIHALVDVSRQREGMAMVQMAAEGFRGELVDELFAGTDHTCAGHAVHPGRVNAVEMQ